MSKTVRKVSYQRQNKYLVRRVFLGHSILAKSGNDLNNGKHLLPDISLRHRSGKLTRRKPQITTLKKWKKWQAQRISLFALVNKPTMFDLPDESCFGMFISILSVSLFLTSFENNSLSHNLLENVVFVLDLVRPPILDITSLPVLALNSCGSLGFLFH